MEYRTELNSCMFGKDILYGLNKQLTELSCTTSISCMLYLQIR